MRKNIGDVMDSNGSDYTMHDSYVLVLALLYKGD